MANPLYEAGPDLALLFLCMKLIITRPQDGIDGSQIPIYNSVKRFISMMEATGAASLLVLQANILVTWYEYGQTIYPAAWMSAGWCVRYGNMLGINEHEEASQLLGRPVSIVAMMHAHLLTHLRELGLSKKNDDEHGGVCFSLTGTHQCISLSFSGTNSFRIVSIGSLRYIINSQEPKNNDSLPVNDLAWVR
jgi:hypothetical protein